MFKLVRKVSKLAYLGPEHTYSYMVAKNYIENSRINIQDAPYKDFDSIIDAVTSKEARFGVLPFFNPYEEHIRECQEKLMGSDLIVIDVQDQQIILNLASKSKNKDKIKFILSNEHVFKQCDVWLSKNFPTTENIFANSTAKAAKDASMDSNMACICSEKAIKNNKLNILSERIQNTKNFTLFFIVMSKDNINEWKKYSLFCFVFDDINERKDILEIADRHNLKYTQKWFFPCKRTNNWLFFIEIEGKYLDLDVRAFEAEYQRFNTRSKIIGTFDESINRLLLKYI